MKEIFEPMIEDIAKNAAEANAATMDDYEGADGLLYCGKCHTAKEVALPNNDRIVSCMCKCATEDYKRREEEYERQRRADNALSNAFDFRTLREWTFANDDGSTPQYTAAARKYCDNFDKFRTEGRGLLLWSAQAGSGKSWLAAMIVNELCSRGISCRMTSFGRILSDLRAAHSEQDYMERLMSYSLLVLDDLGAERDTSYAAEKVYNVIDSRVNVGKPMIVTTNLTIEAIKNPTTEATMRIYSRILKVCHPIHIEGNDRRKIIAANEYQPMQEILGI